MDNAIRQREQLLLSDIIDLETGEIKDNDDPVYYNNIRVIWPPVRTDFEFFNFNLENGETIEIAIGGDTEPTGDGDEYINNMEIALPINDYGRHIKPSIQHKGAGKKYKKTKGRTHKRRTHKRRNHRRKKSRRRRN